MKRLLLTYLLCQAVVPVIAQSTIDKVPPSPTAASIITAGEINTSQFTGTPNINVPLHQVSYHNMAVPISLNYNAQGIKVNEVPGWVGTNWSLNAGGVITRVVNGQADDTPSSGYFALYPPYENAGQLSTNQQIRDYDSGVSDGDPDLFYFSFPGGSGRFMIGHDKSFQVFPHQRIKVDFINSNQRISDGFTITTLDGTVYTFDQVERTTVPASGNLSGGTLPSAWYLSSIKNPSFPGKEITFDYTSYINLDDARKMRSYSAERRFYDGGWLDGLTTVISLKNVGYDIRRLKKIGWETGSVEFIADSARADVAGDSTLNRVRIKDHVGNLLKEYRLTYGYYGGASGKLRLDKVQEFDDTGVAHPPYVFTYEGNDLPAYNATGQDYWGYYNGKDTNQDLLPFEIVSYEEIQRPASANYPFIPKKGHFFIGTADREPNESKLKYGILTGITYPTGGVSQFEYEINRFSSVLTDSAGVSLTVPCSGGVPGPGVGVGFRNEYRYLLNTFGRQVLDIDSVFLRVESGPDTLALSAQKTFVINDAQIPRIDIDLFSDPTSTTYVLIEQDSSGTWVEYYDSRQPGKFETEETHGGDTVVVYSPVLTRELLFTSGTYRVTAYAQGSNGANLAEASIKIKWYVPTGNVNLSGPGLRIRQISQKADINQQPINIRRFEYADSTGRSTGMLYATPIHSYRKFITEFIHGSAVLSPIISQSSSSSYTVHGPALGYSQVTEYFGVTGENGKTVNRYRTTHTDAFPNTLAILNPVLQRPFPPAYYSQWDTGQLLESTVYRKKKAGESGADFKKVQLTVNTYAFQQAGQVKGLAVGLISADPSLNPINSCYYELDYTHISLWEKLVKTEVTRYDLTNEQSGQTTITEFTYESTPDHLQPLSQSLTDSDGKKTIVEYTYPADYSTAHPFAHGLIERNMHAMPIEELNIREDGGTRQVIGGKITEYDTLAYQPKKIYTLKVGNTISEGSFYKSKDYNGSNALTDARYEERMAFGYGVGNLVEQAPTDGMLISYIWGYENTLPVVQGQHITEANLSSAVTWAITNMTSPPVGVTNLDELLTYVGDLSTTAQQEAWENFNTKLRESTLVSNSFITTITYRPGVGMLTQTDPNGLTTTYEYDSFNRLKLVKDPDGKIINTYKYHYKGQ